jgi:hypothetical protein
MTAPPEVAEPTIVTHHIGDVTCILMVPAGCPVPHVALTVYPSSTTSDERVAAVDALELWCPAKHRDGVIWRDRETEGYRATVFLRADDLDELEVA